MNHCQESCQSDPRRSREREREREKGRDPQSSGEGREISGRDRDRERNFPFFRLLSLEPPPLTNGCLPPTRLKDSHAPKTPRYIRPRPVQRPETKLD